MKSRPSTSLNHAPTREAIAIHVLYQMTTHQLGGERIRFDELVAELGVRRFDVRRALWALDRRGLIDAAQISLTLAGIAVGRSLGEDELPVLRPARSVAAVVAA